MTTAVEETTEVEETEEVEEADTSAEDAAALREKTRKTNSENKNLRSRLKAAEEALDDLRKQGMSEQERAIEEAKKAVREEVEAEYKGRLLAAAVRTRATGVLADPDDAWDLIAFDGVDPEDEKAIDAAIKKLVEAKPYLAASNRQRGSGDQGPQGGGTGGGPDANSWFRGVTGRG